MAVPKKKTSKSKRNMRRSHDKLKLVNVVFNKETGEAGLAHQVSIDGYYGSRQIIKPKEKKVEGQEEVSSEAGGNNDAMEVEETKSTK